MQKKLFPKKLFANEWLILISNLFLVLEKSNGIPFEYTNHHKHLHATTNFKGKKQENSVHISLCLFIFSI